MLAGPVPGSWLPGLSSCPSAGQHGGTAGKQLLAHGSHPSALPRGPGTANSAWDSSGRGHRDNCTSNVSGFAAGLYRCLQNRLLALYRPLELSLSPWFHFSFWSFSKGCTFTKCVQKKGPPLPCTNTRGSSSHSQRNNKATGLDCGHEHRKQLFWALLPL